MEQLLTGQDKIQKICDSIRKETLEPAQVEATRIIEDAKKQAALLIKEAEKKIDMMISQAHTEIEKDRTVFQSSLDQAVQLSLEYLKQEIFIIYNEELRESVKEKSSELPIISRIINVIIEAILKEGIKTDIEVVIPKHVTAKEIIAELSDRVREKLTINNIQIGNFEGGAQIKLIDKKMLLDLTNDSLLELLSNYVRKDFRKLIFSK